MVTAALSLRMTTRWISCAGLCASTARAPAAKYDNVRVGMNSRLDAMQAAVLLPKLRALGTYEMDARQMVAHRYNEAFAGRFVTPLCGGGLRQRLGPVCPCWRRTPPSETPSWPT